MIRLGLNSLNAIEKGISPKFIIKVHFQTIEEYTEDDYLDSVWNINSNMSSMGSYEIGNASITLKNIDYYFSRKFAKELPNNKKVEIFIDTGYEQILFFTGIVKDNNWTLEPTLLTLNVNA